MDRTRRPNPSSSQKPAPGQKPAHPQKPANPQKPASGALEQAVEFVRREERRRCAEQLREVEKHAYFEGKEEGYHEGYKAGYRKGWSEASGDPRLAEFYGQAPDERAWAFGVLHLPTNSSAEAVQKAYKDLARLMHPDVNPKLGDRLFQDLTRAKQILLGDG